MDDLPIKFRRKNCWGMMLKNKGVSYLMSGCEKKWGKETHSWFRGDKLRSVKGQWVWTDGQQGWAKAKAVGWGSDWGAMGFGAAAESGMNNLKAEVEKKITEDINLDPLGIWAGRSKTKRSWFKEVQKRGRHRTTAFEELGHEQEGSAAVLHILQVGREEEQHKKNYPPKA